MTRSSDELRGPRAELSSKSTLVRAATRPTTTSGAEAPAREPLPPSRLRAVLRAHYGDVWRVVRRLGIAEASAEDVTQRVFIVAAEKLDKVEIGKERSFLLSTATRIAANHRRSAHLRNELADDDAARARPDAKPGADELLDEKRMRNLLDEVLDSLPEELRAVLVLFELEEVGLTEISVALGIPRGTAASRLRRAREMFQIAARRTRARLALPEEDR